MMDAVATTQPTEELIALIEQLGDKQAALRTVVRGKLEAMGRCDADGMLAASRCEAELTAKASALESRRREVVSRLCAALALPAGTSASSMTLRSLIPKLDPAFRRRLASAADRLREEMLKLAEANRVVDLVCREMMAHFKALFAAMMQSESDVSTYSSGGEVGLAVGAKVLDAVG